MARFESYFIPGPRGSGHCVIIMAWDEIPIISQRRLHNERNEVVNEMVL